MAFHLELPRDEKRQVRDLPFCNNLFKLELFSSRCSSRRLDGQRRDIILGLDR